MNIHPIRLTGKVITLDPIQRDHAADLARVASPELFTYIYRPSELTDKGFSDTIDRVCGMPNWCPFAIVDRGSGNAIGMTAYLDIEPRHRKLEIGFTWIARAYHGTAVNPECKYLLLSHAFEQQQAVRVQLKTDERNRHSRRAIEKLGASFEGVLRNHMILEDGWVRNTAMYSIVADEWPAVKQGLLERVRG